ncbi:MAG TPA: purine-nucleoside phosphorylase [Calditrichaeota bacterium]|nr:purine-nucleoside phosphorylase [Calditrichota bacterium]
MSQEKLAQALQFIRAKTDLLPRAGIILGSGLGDFADTLDNKIKIATEEIPHYPKSTVEGHHGYLVFGTHKNVPLLAVQGRTHYYEGYPIENVTFIVRIMQALGIGVLLVTNAAGGVNPRFKPGDLMLITDQINFLFNNPLIGTNPYGGPRFPDMSDAYSKEFFSPVENIALSKGIALKRGILWVSSGPSYETAAEVKMIRKFGGDAASMSTVPEVITAVQAGLKVMGISCITNAATGLRRNKLSHKEVTETANMVKEKFLTLVSGIIEHIL